VLGHMRSPRALAFLVAQASSGHLDDRYAVARALDAGRFRASDNQAEALWNHGLDVAECLDRLDRLSVEGDDEVSVTLRHWIAHARERQRERLVLLLGCLLPRNLVRATNRRLSLGTEEDRAYALEALETHLPFRHRAHLVPVLRPAPDPSVQVGGHQDGTRQLRTQRETVSTHEDRCSTLAENKDGFFPPALQAAGSLACWRFGRPISAGALARTASSPDRFLSAIAHVLRSTAPERDSSMLDIEKMIILRSVPVFSGLSEQSLADIAGALEEEEVTAGREIIREGEIGDRLYVVVKGDCEVLKGGQVVATLGERSVFGEMALLDPEVRSATVRATQEGLLLWLDHCTLEELMEGDVDLAHSFLKMLCGRLRDANRKLAATSRFREGF
jgi:CRP/FNR family cyclic AMP-dependent transcriptional regulator